VLRSGRHATDLEIVRFVDASTLASLRMNKQPRRDRVANLGNQAVIRQGGSSTIEGWSGIGKPGPRLGDPWHLGAQLEIY
jgi:hypothetical protein